MNRDTAILHNDTAILRELADKYAAIAYENSQKHVWELHASLNDLHPVRPIVLISELPWHELNVDGSLSLRCEDPDFRAAEDYLRKIIFQHTYFPGDMIVKPYFPVGKVIHSTGIGVEVKEEIRLTDRANGVVAHRYENQFTSMEDLEKLHAPVITYDSEASLRTLHKISDAIADIIPVKLVGESTGYGLGHGVWDIISTLMGAEDLLYALVDEPEMMHALAEKLTGIFMDTARQYEELGLLNGDSDYIHSSSAASRKLAGSITDHCHIRLENVWGRGYAQILATVSPEMHDEFEIQYACKSLAPFGLVYYGCCEPLDKKIDIVKKIPHLRKISITPWADINVAAEAVGNEYVISAKPNPANLPCAASNTDLIRRELRELLSACRKNNTPCELLLKDISTADYNLENLVVWNRIAREEIENFS